MDISLMEVLWQHVLSKIRARDDKRPKHGCTKIIEKAFTEIL